MTYREFAFIAPVALALSLGACGGGGEDDTASVYCPPPLRVQDAERLTHFKPGAGRDPRDVAFEAQLLAAGTKCELSRRQLDVTLTMRISVTAGPSVDQGVTRVPYFVRVVSASGGVVQGQDFTADFRLASGSPRGTSQEELVLRLPYNQLTDLGGYRIAVGLKPSQDELNYNRRSRTGS